MARSRLTSQTQGVPSAVAEVLMKVFHTWLAVAVCWSFTAVRANEQTGVPARIDDPRSNTVAWIAADVAVENGQLRPDLLGERLEDLRAIAQRNGRALQDKA